MKKFLILMSCLLLSASTASAYGIFSDDYYITQQYTNVTNVTNVTYVFSSNLSGNGTANYIPYWTNSTNIWASRFQVSDLNKTSELATYFYLASNPNGYISSYVETDPIWTAVKAATYNNWSVSNSTLTTFTNALNANKSGLGSATCSAGFVAQNITTTTGVPTSQCVALPTFTDNVTGTGVSGNLTLWTGTGSLGTAIMYQTGGLVGVNNSAPKYQLDISGSGNVSRVLYAGNMTVYDNIIAGNRGANKLIYNQTLGSLAGGSGSLASGNNAFAYGSDVIASGDSCIALGGAYGFGVGNSCSEIGAISLGSDNIASGIIAVAIGYQSKSTGFGSVAIGGGYASNGVAIGGGANSTASGGIAIGYGKSVGSQSISIAANSNRDTARGISCIAIGGNCKGSQSLSLSGVDVTQDNSIVIGIVNNTQPVSTMIGTSVGGVSQYQIFAQYRNVSIGTNNTPVETLYQDSGTATATYHKFTAGTTTGVTASDGTSVGISAAGEAQIRQYENLNLTLWTNNLERVRVTNLGRTGFNTTAPNQTVEVNGAIQSQNYYSADGTVGYSGTCTVASITSITVKNGLITGCS